MVIDKLLRDWLDPSFWLERVWLVEIGGGVVGGVLCDADLGIRGNEIVADCRATFGDATRESNRHWRVYPQPFLYTCVYVWNLRQSFHGDVVVVLDSRAESARKFRHLLWVTEQEI